jgi:UMF1 family MFS transporter
MPETAPATRLNNPKIIRAWTMYDWANSVYSLVIMSAIFPVYYKQVARQNDNDLVDFFGFSITNTVLYSYAISFSFLIVAILLPVLSGIADYAGRKKFFMKIFVSLGSLSCMGLYFFQDASDIYLAIALSITASIGFAGSLVFYDAFLPEIATEDRYDQVSARGYSMGYYGSVLLMVMCLVLILNPNWFGFYGESAGLEATRVSFLLTGLWWFGFALIPFTQLPEQRKASASLTHWRKGYQELENVWNELRELPELKKYLLAFFFFNTGVQTVMNLAPFFGTDVLRLSSDKLIMTILLIQLVAAGGAWFFARVSGKQGNRFALTVMISIWILVCVAAYFIATEYHFYALAVIIGTIMGGIQSLSRATYSKLLPERTTDNASFFSFYDVAFYLSTVLGTFSFGLVNQLTGSLRYSALALAVYFVIGLILLRQVNASDILKQPRVAQ